VASDAENWVTSQLLSCVSDSCIAVQQMDVNTWWVVCYQYNKNLLMTSHPLSSRWYLSNDDCSKDKREDYQNCSVLYCVSQLCTVICTHIWAVLKVDCWFSFGFSFRFVFAFCIFLPFFPVLFAFVVLGLVPSVLSQEIGYEKHLQDDLFCVEWNIKA